MTKLLPLALHAACTAALALMASHAGAQTSPPGRTTFDQSGCRSCHAYSSRRGAPSVRDMLVTLEGDPNRALEGIAQTPAHANDAMTAAVAENDRRAIAEWVAGAAFDEPEPDPAPPVSPPAAPLAPPAPAPVAPVTVTAPVTQTPLPAIAPPATTAPARLAAASRVVGIAIEPGRTADRLVVTLAGKQVDELDVTSIDGKLIIRLPGAERESRVPAEVTAPNTARAVSKVQSTNEDGTLVLAVAPRTGDLKYVAMQGRNRLIVELTSTPSKKKPAAASPAPVVVAAAKAAAGAKPATVAKPTTTVAKATASKSTRAQREPKKTPEPKAKPEPKAVPVAGTQDKKETEARTVAKPEVEAKAAQPVAAKQTDDNSKQEATAAAKAEADMLASLKASAEALRASGSAEGTKVAKTGRSDRSKLKAPEKFRDEACPPIASSDPIGTVDEARAKDIIDRVGCPQCHAFVQKKTGPPFKKVFEKVKGNPSCVIQRLKKNKEHNEEGVTEDLKGPEFKIVADYLATRAK